MKRALYILSLARAKILLVSYLSLCLFSLSAQDEKVIFDFDKGNFNIKKIPYVHPLTITGLATKNGEEIDAIQLTITKNTDNEQQKLDANKYKQYQLTKDIDQYNTQLDNLVNANSKSKVDDIVQVLTSGGFTDLAKEITGTKDITPDIAKGKITAKSKNLTTELTAKKDEKITLDKKEVLDLQTIVSKNQFYQNVWIRSGTSKEFNFSLGKSLEMSSAYTFSFTIYQANKSTFPIDDLIIPIKDDLEKVLTNIGFISKEDLTKKFNAVLDKINSNLFANTLAINPDGTTSLKGLQISDDNRKGLIENIAAYYAVTASLNSQKRELESNVGEIEKLINNLTLTGTRLGDLKKMVELEAQYNPTNFINAIPAATPAATIQTIKIRYDVLKDARESITSLEKKQKESLNSINATFDFVKKMYTEKGNITQAGQTSTSGDTDLDGIRLSTVYGFGVVPLENDFGSIEWFQYIGVNIRWDDFDNRLPGKSAYKSLASRFAVTIGLATSSDMQYRGQHLDNLRIGFKPVIGLSFEPCKHVNLSTGIISFIPSAIGNSQQDPKVRPYFSLAFDFNLFNYLIQKQ